MAVHGAGVSDVEHEDAKNKRDARINRQMKACIKRHVEKLSQHPVRGTLARPSPRRRGG